MSWARTGDATADSKRVRKRLVGDAVLNYNFEPYIDLRIIHIVHEQTSITIFLTVNIIYLIPFVSMCHTANIELHSSRKDHPVAG